MPAGASMAATTSASAASWAPVSARTSGRAPTIEVRGRTGAWSAYSSSSSPRPSSRRAPAWSQPVAEARSLTRAGPAASASSAARWRVPSRASPARASRPAAVMDARSDRRGPIRRPLPVPVPGGSTSARPRAGVDTYSRATQSPRFTSSGGTSASSADSGSASFSGGTSLCSATSTTTPRMRRRANGTTSIEPTPTPPIPSPRR